MSVPISFRRDDVVLRGTLHEGSSPDPRRTMLLLHGSPAEPNDVLGLGERWARQGFNVLTFRYSGNLDSGGLSSFENSQLDIAAAHRFLHERVEGLDDSNLILGGWSYGGGMALTYAANHPSIKTVFSIAGTDHGAFMREYAADSDYRRMVDSIFESVAAPDSAWRLAPGATPKEALAAGHSMDAYDHVLLAPRLADRRILLIGAWDDRNIKIETHVLPLYRALKSAGSTTVSIKAFNDTHAFENTREDLATTIIEWVTRSA